MTLFLPPQTIGRPLKKVPTADHRLTGNWGSSEVQDEPLKQIRCRDYILYLFWLHSLFDIVYGYHVDRAQRESKPKTR